MTPPSRLQPSRALRVWLFVLATNLMAGLRLLWLAGYRFVFDGCGTMSASLSYTTLLATVPLLTVTFSMLSSLAELRPLRDDLDNFIFTLLLPEVGQDVRTALHVFMENAAQLGVPGYLLLTFAVLLLVVEVDVALLRIWGAGGIRKRLRNVLIIATVFLGAPLLIAVTLGALSYIVTLPAVAKLSEAPIVYRWCILSLPFVTSLLGFLLVYGLVPHWRVPFRSAWHGAIVAAVLFEISRSVFIWYVHHAWLQPRVYGAFAAIPFSLVWVYTCWAILLYGAQLTHLLSVPEAPRARWRYPADGEGVVPVATTTASK